MFRRFGTVLAATIQLQDAEGTKSSRALLTFVEAAESQRALDGAAALGVDGLAASRAESAEEALGEASAGAHRARVRVGIAVACVGPLMETAFAADVSVVDAAEYQHAQIVLGEMHALDPIAVAASAWHEVRCITLGFGSPGNAYQAVFQKTPSALTRDDALTVACSTISYAIYFSRGPDLITAAGAFTWDQTVGALMEHGKLSPSTTASEEFLLRLSLLLLDLFRDPQGTAELALAGGGMALAFCMSGRVALAPPLIDAGLIKVIVATMRRSSPMEWLSWKTTSAIVAGVLYAVFPLLSTVFMLFSTAFRQRLRY